MGALIHVTSWERVSPWRRALAALARVALLLVLLDVLLTFLGPPIGFFITARWAARNCPGVKVAPTPLVDYSVSNAEGTSLSYFGYSFEVPWHASYSQRALPKSNLVELRFDSGQDLTFIVPAVQSGLLSEMAQDKSMQSLQNIFGDLMQRSAYDQYSALLNTTPSTIAAFGPRADAVRGITLLTIKAIAVGPGLETGVFSVQLRDKRAFQIGDPRKSKRADLEIFDQAGHHVEFICATTKNGVPLSQPEINRILTSLKVDPTAPTANSSAMTD
jgi:hypothetical protein